MPEWGTYGSVRGVPGNGHPYRDMPLAAVPVRQGRPQAGIDDGPLSGKPSNKVTSRQS